MGIISLFFLPLAALTTRVHLLKTEIYSCSMTLPPIEVLAYFANDYSFGLHTVATMIFATIIPFFLHNSFYNRNQLDADLALPIKKWKMATTNFIFGVLALIAISLFSFTLGFTIYAIKGLPLRFGMLILYFLVIIVVALFMYILVYFALSFVHTTIDGAMLLGLILLLPIFMSGVVSMNFTFGSNTFAYRLEEFLLLFNPIGLANEVQQYFTISLINQPAEVMDKIAHLAALGCAEAKYYTYLTGKAWELNNTIMLIIYALLGGGLSYLTIRRIVTDKAEYAGTKETAPHLTYYGIIIVAFLAILAFIELEQVESIVFAAFIFTAYFVAMFVNARKITLTKRILIPFGIIVGVALIIKLILLGHTTYVINLALF